MVSIFKNQGTLTEGGRLRTVDDNFVLNRGVRQLSFSLSMAKQLRSAAFDYLNITYFLQVLNEEVNLNEPYPAVSTPCQNF